MTALTEESLKKAIEYFRDGLRDEEIPEGKEYRNFLVADPVWTRKVESLMEGGFSEAYAIQMTGRFAYAGMQRMLVDKDEPRTLLRRVK